MKKILNPKLDKEKVAIIKDSSSQEKLDDSENDNKEIMKSKKPIVSKYKSIFTDTNIFDIFLEI